MSTAPAPLWPAALRNGLLNSILPLCLALFVLLVGLSHHVLPVPSIPELFAVLSDLFREHGLPALFVSAFLEGLFLLSFYVPGSLVIVLGVIVAADDPQKLVAIAIACWTGIMLAMIVDYAIGRFGFYRLFAALGADSAIASTQSWMNRWGRAAIFLAAVHPNLLALVMVCAGIGRTGFFTAMTSAAVASALWIPLALFLSWAFFHGIDLENADPLPVILGLFLLWAAVLFIRGFLRALR